MGIDIDSENRLLMKRVPVNSNVRIQARECKNLRGVLSRVQQFVQISPNEGSFSQVRYIEIGNTKMKPIASRQKFR